MFFPSLKMSQDNFVLVKLFYKHFYAPDQIPLFLRFAFIVNT
ncbi:hypothetical protein M23134_02252 [Microscilla marina ATCC 23134]|uniref:Uncharacterized protein n=1 Tax=Microscilla marina ATCC 23134 TaxID=313606 RepID=A1ZK35_MICM2|nr:hypothetical protein M23134_02252 [Microscilla marina ATCC 23134]